MNKLKEVCTVISGYAFKASDLKEDADIPVIKIGNISNKSNIIVDKNTQYVDNSFKNIDEKFHIREGDILISLTGSHINQPNSMVGRCCRNYSEQLFLLNQRAGKVIENKNKVNKDYLYYLLSTDAIKYTIANMAYGGANQVNVSPKDIMNIKYDMPDITMQEKISAILLNYDKLIENNNTRITILEQIAEEIYKEWFVRFRFPNYNKYKFVDGIPECFRVVKVYDYINFEKGFEPGASFYLEDNSKLPFNRVGDIENRKSQYYIDKELFKEIKLLKKEDVVISFDASIGKMGYGLEGAYSSGVCKISGKNKKIIGNLLVWSIFHNESMQAQIQSYANGSTIGHAGKCIKKIRMLYNEELFKLYTEKTECIYQELINLITQNNILTEQRDMLLPRLMSGKLEVK